MLWVIGRCFLVVVVTLCCLLCCFSALGGVASRDFGHKCEPLFACTCIAMAIHCACIGSVLYARAYGGFSLNDTS